MVSVKECIENNGDVSFQNSVGFSLDNFFTLLQFYLDFTFIVFDEQPSLQRDGICIGSCVAPILCDLFLADAYKTLEQVFNGRLVIIIFRYVDFLVLLKKQPAFT